MWLPSAALFSALLLSRYSTARILHPTGINFDDSCEPYTRSLNDALQSVHKMAVSAYKAAAGQSSPYFSMFFRPDDVFMVQLVMKNIVHAIGGHGQNIVIKCNEDRWCLEISARDVGAYVQRRHDWREDYINVCKHSLDGGPRSLPITNDWCSLAPTNITLASILLHELTHMYPIADYTGTNDWAWGQHECKELTRMNVKDQYGEVLLPVDNAQSYVWYAQSQLWWSSLYDSKLCPQIDKQELRRQLLGVQGEDAALSLPDLPDMSRLGDVDGNLLKHTPPNLTDIVTDP